MTNIPTQKPKPLYDRSEVLEAVRSIVGAGEVTELRALDAVTQQDKWPHIESGYFDDPDELVKAVGAIKSATGIYIVPNPIDQALLARAHNRTRKAKRGESTQDTNIQRRRWLLIDADAQRPSGISASDEEHEAAIELTRSVYLYLKAAGWPDPIAADSGNGGHLMYCIDLPAEDEGLVKLCLAALARRFDDDVVTIDQSVFNPARIWKLYGTLACKGDDTPDRPHRMACILSQPKKLQAVPRHLLETLAAEAGEDRGRVPTPNHEGNGQAFDVAAFIVRHSLDVSGPEDWNGEQGPGRRWVFNTSKMCEHHDGAAFIVQHVNGAISARCHHDSCSWSWRDLRKKFEPKQDQLGQCDAVQSGASQLSAPVPLCAVRIQPMPDGIVGGWFGEMVEAVATATETPRELSTLMGLGVLATTCQKRFSIRPEADYFEPLNAWLVCALPSGNRKSAVVDTLSRPLIEWEQEQAAIIEPSKRLAESERATLESQIRALRQKAGRAKTESGLRDLKQRICEIESQLPAIPTLPVLFTDDVTPEHLGTMLHEHDEKMAIISDEGGVFDLMAGRYSKNGIANLDVWLKGHSGSTVRVDRGSRPPVHLRHPALTIAISPQPDVLRGLAEHQGFRGRGLLARFVYCIPRSNLGYRSLKACPIPERITQAFAQGITTILNTPPAFAENGMARPRVLRLTSQAWAAWKDHARLVESEMRPGGRFESINDWAGKFPGQVARLAGLLHVAENSPGSPEAVEVSADTMSRTIELADLLAEHALLVFDLIGTDSAKDGATRIWQWIERERRQEFTKRDCWHPLRGTFKRVKDIEPSLNVLIDTGHIERVPSQRTGPGPKGDWFRVHRAVLESWANGSNYYDQDDQHVDQPGGSDRRSGHFGHSGLRTEHDGDWDENP